mgnify:CR=1 FL=1
MIELRHLRKEYEDITPLEDVNVTINSGDVISVIGPSGTGKSTLLRCINFLEEVRPHAEVLSVCEIADETSLHRILSKQTQRECARINIQWQALNNLDS